MIKLPPDVKVGCPMCKHELDRIKIKDVKELAFLIDDSNSMKQTTLNPPKANTSTKRTTLF